MISSILLALYNEYNHSKMTETQSVLCNIINQIFQIIREIIIRYYNVQ